MPNRVLKRPMFRRGGMANQGIMSGLVDRTGYQEGDLVKQRQEIEQELYPATLVGDTSRLLTNIDDLFYNYGLRPLGNLANYVTGMGEGINTIKKRDKKEDIIDKVMEIRGLTEESSDADPDADSGESNTAGKDGKGTGTDGTGTDGTGTGGELSEADLKTVYADLLPMFQETLGVDGDDFKKDAYLQLARFGTNLMAQPGGSLTAAIGRAAEKPLEGVGELIGAKRAAERRPKELALQAALRETEPGNIAKAYRDFKKLGYSDKEIKKYLIERGTGEATLAQVKARTIDGDADALMDLTNNKSDSRKIAQQMYKYGITYADVEGKLPEDKTNLVEGGYYVDKIKGGGYVLKRHSKGVLYSVGEKGFIVTDEK
jgi:hypothetical protein